MQVFLFVLVLPVLHSQLLSEEYFDESQFPNIFDEFSIVVSEPVKARSWERRDGCHFPNANHTIRLDSIREGLWVPLAYLRHSDNHLHPFVSPYGPLRCLRVMTRFDPARRWLSLHYGCRPNASLPWSWDFRFEFLPNKRIIYRNRYGCTASRQLRRTVLADTDYENYLLFHGCQTNAAHYQRANGMMVLVRTLALGSEVHGAIGNYTRQVLQPHTKLTYFNLTEETTGGAVCDCSVARRFVFCDPKYRFRHDPEEKGPPVNSSLYWCMVLPVLVALLMATLVLRDQLYTFQSTLAEASYQFID